MAPLPLAVALCAAGDFGRGKWAHSPIAADDQRIEKINPVLSAPVEVSINEALDTADKADDAIAAGELVKPLHGVPVSIKVNSDRIDHATTHGITAFEKHVATEDILHVANLRKAEAIFIGRSNIQEQGLKCAWRE